MEKRWPVDKGSDDLSRHRFPADVQSFKSRIMRLALPVFLLATGLLSTSCLKDDVKTYVSSYSEEERAVLQEVLRLPEHLHDYNVFLPDHLGGFQTPIDPHQAVLGRVLFYDRALSASGSVSCASCHRPELAFSDDKAFSIGALGERTSRNSLGLGAFPSFGDHYNGFGGARLFWDERAGTVSEQARQSFLNPEEMGHSSLDEMVAYVKKQPHYQILLRKAFPGNGNFPSDEQKILEALQAFVHAIGCFDTKFDRAMRQEHNPEKAFAAFSQQENLGKTLFLNHCQSCHSLGSSFQSFMTQANNGLDLQYADQGVGAVSGQPLDMGVFKVPMLRNIALTAPYMHDGRFATLEEVVEHYDSGIQDHPNLHGILRHAAGPLRLNLSTSEKEALVAFLHTLTDDRTLMQDRFSDPFSH